MRSTRFLSAVIVVFLACIARGQDSELLDKAKKGDAASQFAVAMQYRDGKGVEKDYKEALRWSRLAADQGYAAALDNLGFHYFQGWGVPQDFDIALGYFKAAGARGSAWGLYNMGRCCFGGQGTPQNYADAMTWWKKAAEKGHGHSAMHVAMMHASGDGIERDEAEAIRWCKKAIELGSSDGNVLLGEILFRQGKRDEATATWKESADKKNVQATALLQIADLRIKGGAVGKAGYVEVSHVHQGYNNCGSTTVTMAARFQGAKVTQYEIKRACPGGPIGTGTDWAELLAAVGKQQLNWKLTTFAHDADGFEQALSLLKKEIDEGRPLVIDFTVKSSRGGSAGHTLLATGYLDGGETVILRDPAHVSPGIRLMSKADLEQHWHSRGYSHLAKGKSARPALVLTPR